MVTKTLDATTQSYLNIPGDGREEPLHNFVSRAPGLCLPRQKETVASDTFFPLVVSNRGNTCSRMFHVLTSKFWAIYPLKTESRNTEALQDYTRTHGCMSVLKTNNTQSELGKGWTNHCKSHCIEQQTTEPHHPHQNPVEHQIGDLAVMVKRCMKEFQCLLRKHDWMQKWCVDVHNILPSCSLSWRTPHEWTHSRHLTVQILRLGTHGTLMELQRYQNLALRKDVGLVLLGLPETPSLLLLRLKGLYEKDARWYYFFNHQNLSKGHW